MSTARRAGEALVRIAENLPDLIISDIRMPGMDGYQLVQKIRSSPRTRLVPIIFLTAKDEISDRVVGFRSGVDAYITKPFETEELVAVVAAILERVQRTHSDLARMFGEGAPRGDRLSAGRGIERRRMACRRDRCTRA